MQFRLKNISDMGTLSKVRSIQVYAGFGLDRIHSTRQCCHKWSLRKS